MKERILGIMELTSSSPAFVVRAQIRAKVLLRPKEMSVDVNNHKFNDGLKLDLRISRNELNWTLAGD